MKVASYSRYLPFLIPLASLLYYLSYFNYGLTMNDEGLLVDSVMRVLSGQLPLRDFYSYAPGRYYYLAAWFELFGANLLTERVAFIAVRILTPAFLFLIARRFLPLSLALIPVAMVALIAGPWEKTVDTFIPIINLWLILRCLEQPTWLRLVLAGLVAGLALMWKQDAGSLAILAGSISIILLTGTGASIARRQRSNWAERAKRWLVYLGGIFLGILPFTILYAMHGAVSELFLGQYTAVRVYETIGVSFPSPFMMFDLAHPKGALQVFLLYAYLLLLISFPVGLLFKIRNRESVSPSLIATWLFGCAASPNIFIYPAFSRLTQTAPISYVLGAIGCVWLVQAVRDWSIERYGKLLVLSRAIAGVCLLISIGFLGFGFTESNMYVGSLGIRIGRTVPLGLSRAPIYESPDLAKDIQEVVKFIERESAPGSSIFASHDYFFYFLADRRNPTGVYFFPALLNQDLALQTRLLIDLEQSKPSILIRRRYELERITSASQWWEDYIQQNYVLRAQNLSNLIYVRKSSQTQ